MDYKKLIEAWALILFGGFYISHYAAFGSPVPGSANVFLDSPQYYPAYKLYSPILRDSNPQSLPLKYKPEWLSRLFSARSSQSESIPVFATPLDGPEDETGIANAFVAAAAGSHSVDEGNDIVGTRYSVGELSSDSPGEWAGVVALDARPINSPRETPGVTVDQSSSNQSQRSPIPILITVDSAEKDPTGEESSYDNE